MVSKQPGSAAYAQAKIIMAKMKRVMDSASVDQRKAVNAYLCLANMRLNRLQEEVHWTDSFGIAGGGMGAKRLYESKFGKWKGDISDLGYECAKALNWGKRKC
jgi:agmatine/peptidylarginine deiminase